MKLTCRMARSNLLGDELFSQLSLNNGAAFFGETIQFTLLTMGRRAESAPRDRGQHSRTLRAPRVPL